MLANIRRCFDQDGVLYTSHARIEMVEEEFGRIREHEVYEAIQNGEIIEEYSDDRPYPSVLIYGKSNNGKTLHVVCAYSDEDDLTIIVTVYRPNPDLWDEYRRRI